MGDQHVARPLPTHRTTQTLNKGTQTSMPWLGFEPRNPELEQVKTFHALHRATTVIDSIFFSFLKCKHLSLLLFLIVSIKFSLYLVQH
jgi:hypothetical protein